MVFLSNYDFYVDTDESNYLESLDGTYHSYTFPIYKTNNQKDNEVQNLFLSYNVLHDNYDTFIVTYNLTPTERENFANNHSIKLQGKVSLEYLSDFVPDVIFNSSLVYINLETNSITCWEEIYGTSQGTGWQDIVGWEQTPCPWHTSNSGGGETSSSPSGSGSDTTSEIPSGYSGEVVNWNPGGPSGGGTSSTDTTSEASPSSTPPATATYILSLEAQRKKTFRRIQLTPEQNSMFGNLGAEAQDTIYEFLESQLELSSSLSEYSEEAVDLNVNAIDNLINFTETDYPGNMNGYPFEWWLDNDFILNSGNFDMPSDNPLEVDESPNAKKVALFSIFPLEAAIHIDNTYDAKSKSEALVASGQLTGIGNGKADAFRHAYWNAIGTAAFSIHVMKLFADAH